eukprot:jgi/Botrbrau1/19770/Bobra.0124s0022.1
MSKGGCDYLLTSSQRDCELKRYRILNVALTCIVHERQAIGANIVMYINGPVNCSDLPGVPSWY